MSQRRVLPVFDEFSFDSISQSCEQMEVEDSRMPVESSCLQTKVEDSKMPDVTEVMKSRIEIAQTMAAEVLGPEATLDDAMLFVDDIDDTWLEASIDAEFNEMQLAEAPVQPVINVNQERPPHIECCGVVGGVVDVDVKVELAGFRILPHPDLANAGKGQEKMRSDKNNRWSLRRANKLRHALGWDMSVSFGDLPLTKVDELLANLFSRVVKVKGGEYPAESLMNMLGGYNRLLRRASDLRALKDPKAIPLGKDFNIKKHPAFTRTRLTLDAAIKKTAKDGTNKKRKKVNHLTESMEGAVLADVDHQIFHNEGCQKRTAFYLLVRCGIRGGDELWQLKRYDLLVKTDKHGREYVQYMERASKSNCYTLERTKEEQFCKPYHSYEEDFVLTAKQYLRHMPPFVEGNSDSLFLGCIRNLASIVWFNRLIKVGKNTSSNWLKNMLKLVGLPEGLFSNKSGRATLVTRLAAQGVPDHVGMLLTGHRTADGYSRYDRTKDLQQEAAALVAYNPQMTYDIALSEVSKRFVKEDLVGSNDNLKPLIFHVSGATSSNPVIPVVSEISSVVHLPKSHVSENTGPSNVSMAAVQSEASSSKSTLQFQASKLLENMANQMPKQIQDRTEDKNVKVADHPNKLAILNADYDGIDWEAAMRSDPRLAVLLGGARAAVASVNNFSNCQNCTIQINMPPTSEWAKMFKSKDNKENRAP